MEPTLAGGVVITVANAGRIPPELLPHVFDPFRGGGRTSGRHDGLGLGLYIVQQIVHAHRGTIEARNEGERRIAFCVTLPRRSQDVVEH